VGVRKSLGRWSFCRASHGCSIRGKELKIRGFEVGMGQQRADMRGWGGDGHLD
jgi:hypothetical protein